VPEDIQERYRKKLANAWFKEKAQIKEQAKKEGILIIDNGGKIADSTRQCVNSRIQGSAADLTKLAMIRLNNNQELKDLGFRLLIPVHDEVIAECPEENIKQCSELLAKTMSAAAEEILKMPIKCDVAITKCWYGEEMKIK
jgi:DNA polymerase I-like protein with 3'-5' exonuclease and polymerase domains